MDMVKVDELSSHEYHEKLLGAVKAQVKAIMEESVTKKFVHEESEHVLRLCTTIHTCLLHRLRKRTAGFLRTNKIASLFNKIGKSLPEVAQLVVKIEETESAMESQISHEGRSQNVKRPHNLQLKHFKQLWVRIALTEKKLDKILEFLVENNRKFYEKDSIFSDPVRGRILASLLVGPCALEYTKMKTSDHYWSDPPADELLQRHKLHCRNEISSPSGRPKLQSTSKYSSVEPSEKVSSNGGTGNAFREYVESLHQNSKSTLLYGKNNVDVQPREELKPIRGYLSLHQVMDSLFIKWTPNQLMNVNEQKKSVNCNHDTESDDADLESEVSRPAVIANGGVNKSNHQKQTSFLKREMPNHDKPKRLSSYWEYAISVNVEDVVYLHCHHRNDARGTLVLVGQDGVQRPPICFPQGGHLLAFLTCLETGLLPHGHLDPPLWLQRGKGKVFPKLRKRSSQSSSSSAGSQSEAEDATDFVFRVTTAKSNVSSQQRIEIDPVHENFDAYNIGPGYSCYNNSNQSYSSRSSLKVLCATMRRQIISRAFYGWLAHCRHLSTVRTHLSALVLPDDCPLPEEPVFPIDAAAWNSFSMNGEKSNVQSFMRRVYFGGVEHNMRIVIWPYLLNHYPMGSDSEERERIDAETLQNYERIVHDWKIAEKIIKSKEKESLASKLSCDSRTSSSSSLEGPPKQCTSILRKQSTMSDVFASLDQDSVASVNGSSAVSNGNEAHLDKPTNHIHGHVSKKRHIFTMKERYKTDFSSRGSKSQSDHTPYSSISTEPSTIDRRLSNTTIASSIQDGVVMSIDEDGRLDNIAECEQELELQKDEIRSTETDLEAKKSARCAISLQKQDGIDQGVSQDLDEEDELYLEQPQYPNYTTELLNDFALNLHSIEKDVHRCDRNHEYFTNSENLEKLQNIMCSYVWKNLGLGYRQGMCDLAAPLLLVMDDESKVFSCFSQLMKRMECNFQSGGAMDAHFANMRSLLQVTDSELFEHILSKGDYTHFYFCYRWFLLDFKRELSYDNDVFAVWEAIWAAKNVCSEQFVLFFALALLHNYRDIILDNEMDFTDIIKFFNEMAERHNATKILKIAQNFVHEIQSMISK